ncbi:MAG: DUF4105 domain-containing protein [Bdellovibrionales bacterium]|nr:DUF4105 domain-containing protein [Bdellovibrionales bacterium]
MRPFYFNLLFIFFSASTFAQNFYSSQSQVESFVNNSNYASLAFAAEDFKSPVSSFGHIFIVFHNQSPEPEASAVVLEFVGDMREDNLLLKSLLSTIPGKYKFSTFFHKKREYELENRNLFIAPMNLNSAEFERLKEFSIQYSKNQYEYNFLLENCSKYINELILKALENHNCELPKFNNPYVNYQSLKKCGLIEDNYFYPSTANEFLDTVEFKLDKLSQSSQNKLINYEILRQRHEFKRDKLLQKKINLLSKIQNFSHTPLKQNIKLKTLSRIYLKTTLHKDDNLSLGVTPAHLFFTNNFDARFWTDTLKLFDVEARFKNNSVELSYFDLFKVRTFQAKNPLFSGFTRSINIYYQKYDSKNDNYLKETVLNYGFGKTMALSPYVFASALFNFETAHYDSPQNSNFYLRTPLELVLNVRIENKSKLYISHKHYLNKNKFKNTQTQAKLLIYKYSSWTLSYKYEHLKPIKSETNSIQLDYLF